MTKRFAKVAQKRPRPFPYWLSFKRYLNFKNKYKINVETIWEREDIRMDVEWNEDTMSDQHLLFEWRFHPPPHWTKCFAFVFFTLKTAKCWQWHDVGIQTKLQNSQKALWDCATLGFSPLGRYCSAIFHRRLLSCTRSQAAKPNPATPQVFRRSSDRELTQSVNSPSLLLSSIFDFMFSIDLCN